MNQETRLLSFHFGAIEEEERLAIERELLVDSERLLDYFDLKRQLEAAGAVPSGPSSALWGRLVPHAVRHRRVLISFSVGAAIAAGIAAHLLLQPNRELNNYEPPKINRVLFDASAELPASAGVL